MTTSATKTTVEVVTVETDQDIATAIERMSIAGFDLAVIRAGDGLHYLPWETEDGEHYAIRPATEDEYDRTTGGPQSVQAQLDNLPLPWTVAVQAAPDSAQAPADDAATGFNFDALPDMARRMFTAAVDMGANAQIKVEPGDPTVPVLVIAAVQPDSIPDWVGVLDEDKLVVDKTDPASGCAAEIARLNALVEHLSSRPLTADVQTLEQQLAQANAVVVQARAQGFVS